MTKKLLESILFMETDGVTGGFSDDQVGSTCQKLFGDAGWADDMGINAMEEYTANQATIDNIVNSVESGTAVYSMAGGDSVIKMAEGGMTMVNVDGTSVDLNHEEALITVSLLFNDAGNALQPV